MVCCVESLALKVALCCSNVPTCHLLGQQSVCHSLQWSLNDRLGPRTLSQLGHDFGGGGGGGEVKGQELVFPAPQAQLREEMPWGQEAEQRLWPVAEAGSPLRLALSKACALRRTCLKAMQTCPKFHLLHFGRRLEI